VTTETPPRLDLERARAVLEQARQAATGVPGAEVEITLEETQGGLTRFANNAIHQHVGEAALALSVRTQFDRRCARASTHRLDAIGIREVVDRALHLTRSQSEDPDLLEMAPPQPIPAAMPAIDRFDAETAAITPAQRATAVQAMVAAATARQLTAAGICATRMARLALLNSRGLEAFYASTGAEYSVTMLAANSSGWAKGSSPAWRDLDPAAGALRAAEKAVASSDPVAVPAGRYTVILEPAAVLDLLGFLMWDFGGQSVLDQRSFLSDRVGTQLFGPNIAIADDAYHPLQSGPPFDGEGVPRQRVPLVEAGWVRRLVFARQTAALWNQRQAGGAATSAAAPTGHGFPLPNEYGEAPLNVVFAGGDIPLDRMIAETERGILVTRLWYIREVDPYKKILTGMTRDGTFLIEHGRLSHGVRNFRFNQNMVELLNQVEAMSPAVRASGEESFDMVVPALKVRAFNFTEVTKF
jgi:predicted Zn-dependent protease